MIAISCFWVTSKKIVGPGGIGDLLLVGVVVAVMALVMLSTPVYGECEWVQTDDFEWGIDSDPLSDSGGGISWTTETQGCSKAEIETANYYEGLRCARLYRDGLNRPIANFAQSAVGSFEHISFWVRKDFTADFLLYHGNGAHVVAVRIDASQNLMYHDVSGWQDTGVNVAAFRWYLLQIRNVDWLGETFDVYLNEVFITSASSFWDAVGANNQVQFQIYAGTAEVWLDNVAISDVSGGDADFAWWMVAIILVVLSVAWLTQSWLLLLIGALLCAVAYSWLSELTGDLARWGATAFIVVLLGWVILTLIWRQHAKT